MSLIKNMPYTVEADGSYTPDPYGLENGDDVKVLVADSALDDDEIAQEPVTYFYSIGEWTELPAGADIATIAKNIRTAIDNIEIAAAGTAIVKIDGKHHFDPSAVLKGGEGEIDAAELSLVTETSAFDPPEDGKIGSYVTAIDAKFQRLRRFGFSHDLTSADVAAAGTPLQMPPDEPDGYSYELDMSHLSSATLNAGTGAHTHNNGWKILAQVDLTLGEVWLFSNGNVPVRRADLDHLTASDDEYWSLGIGSFDINVYSGSGEGTSYGYFPFTANGLNKIQSPGTKALPVQLFGATPLISWANNEFLKNTYQNNPDTQFSIDVVIPVK